MSEKKQDDLRMFRLDCFLALHQRSCWAAAAVLAVAGALIIVRTVSGSALTYAALALAFLLMAAYRWAAGAPARAIRKWSGCVQSKEAGAEKKMLDFILALEKTLPSMKKKEMNYTLTGWKAVLMNALGQREEALELLKGFDQYWDRSQRDQFDALIRKIEGKNDSPHDEGA